MSNDLVKQWLEKVLRPYPSRDLISTEVSQVLDQRRTLSVKTDAYTFDSGHTALLLLLHGTLPIMFRGATYHIPVNVWLPLEYPRAAPMVYVVPTKEMGIRKGREVDPGGRVKGEVVDEWWKSWDPKTISNLLQQLTTVFSAAPPVYARPSEAAAPSPQRLRPMSPPQRSASPAPLQNGSPSGQPPPPPARPGFRPVAFQPEYRPAPTLPPLSYPLSPIGEPPLIPQRTASQSVFLPSAQQPPRPPPKPPLGYAGPSSQAYRPQTPPNGDARNLPQQRENGAARLPLDQYRPQPTSPAQYAYPQQSGSPQSSTQQQQLHHPAVPQRIQPPLVPQIPYQAQPSQFPLTPAQPTQQRQPIVQANLAQQAVRQQPEDLLSSPTPSFSPLPTNPLAPPPLPSSKPPPPSLLHLHSILLPHIQSSLPPLLHHLHTTRAHLLERREDLISGEPAIRDEMARLEAVKNVCDNVGSKMGDLVTATEERVRDLEARGEVGVDEVVCGISIVHNQLVDLVAEDNAIEDTIYHLTRALDSERIDLDRFLKVRQLNAGKGYGIDLLPQSIRSLAREQYMKRALIERILQGMGQKQGW
ncbi:hypothetical protein P7C73_g386, partial [Tremellales sp. Uapishka_1]